MAVAFSTSLRFLSRSISVRKEESWNGEIDGDSCCCHVIPLHLGNRLPHLRHLTGIIYSQKIQKLSHNSNFFEKRVNFIWSSFEIEHGSDLPNFLFRYLMMNCESATVSPLYSIHGTLPFALNPPFSVNCRGNRAEDARIITDYNRGSPMNIFLNFKEVSRKKIGLAPPLGVGNLPIRIHRYIPAPPPMK